MERKEAIKTLGNEINEWIERLQYKKELYLELKATYGRDCSNPEKLQRLEDLKKEMKALIELVCHTYEKMIFSGEIAVEIY